MLGTTVVFVMWQASMNPFMSKILRYLRDRSCGFGGYLWFVDNLAHLSLGVPIGIVLLIDHRTVRLAFKVPSIGTRTSFHRTVRNIRTAPRFL